MIDAQWPAPRTRSVRIASGRLMGPWGARPGPDQGRDRRAARAPAPPPAYRGAPRRRGARSKGPGDPPPVSNLSPTGM